MTPPFLIQDVDSKERYRILPPCVIGRGAGVDLAFPDLSISHRHALVTEAGGHIWIEDLRSANGVFVNDRKIDDKVLLRSGDLIQLGRAKFLVGPEAPETQEQTIILDSLPLTEEWRLDHKRLRVMYEIASELTENQDIGELGEKIFSRFREVFAHDRGYVAILKEDGTLRPIFCDFADESIPLSRSITARVFQTGESLLLEDAIGDASFGDQESVMALRIRSALCAPLIYRERIYGLIYLDRGEPGAYALDDLEFFRSVASILAPLIENARLWSELKSHYDDALMKLKETEARLIDTERTAAYVRLAQAMAHEMRNPIMVIGGLVRRMGRPDRGGVRSESFAAINEAVERVESVLKEVDSFARIPQPQMKLTRVDELVGEEIRAHDQKWGEKSLSPRLLVNTSHLMIPLDGVLIRKAVGMIFQEIIFGLPPGSDLTISIGERGKDIEILLGEPPGRDRLCELYDADMRDKPWARSLFLSVAHKILSDHGGKLLLDPGAHVAFPIVMRIPRFVNP